MIDAVINEHENVEIRISDEGWNHFSETGAHDDLVCALGMPCYCGDQFGTREIKIW